MFRFSSLLNLKNVTKSISIEKNSINVLQIQLKGGGGELLSVESLLPKTLPCPFPDPVSHDLLHELRLQVVSNMLDPLPQRILSVWLWIAIHALLHE